MLPCYVPTSCLERTTTAMEEMGWSRALGVCPGLRINVESSKEVFCFLRPELDFIRSCEFKTISDPSFHEILRPASVLSGSYRWVLELPSFDIKVTHVRRSLDNL